MTYASPPPARMRWVAGLGDAGETAAVITTLVVITAFVAVGLRKGIFGRSSDAQVLAALALLVASVPFLSNGSLVSATVRYRGMVVQFVIATVTLVIVVLVSAKDVRELLPRNFAALLMPALVEEYVFRVHLVRRLRKALARLIRDDRALVLAACLLAQFTFAVCHTFRLGSMAAHSLASLEGRLLLEGICYWLIVQRGGVGVAAGVHASLNFHLLAGPGLPSVVSAWILAPAVVVLWMVSATLIDRRRSVGTPAAPNVAQPRSGQWKTSAGASEEWWASGQLS